MQAQTLSDDEKVASGRASTAYIPALDGFRGASILMLMLSHGGLQRQVPGVLALLCFFVISSFLLTRQMIVEIEKTGKLNLRAFYLRRVFRLIPALLGFIAIFTLISGMVGSRISFPHIASVLFYFANYYHIYFGYPAYNPFPIVWSLSVEEHYYIVFPFCMLLCRRDLRKILPWLLATLPLALLWRITVYKSCHTAPEWWLCGLPDSPRWKGTDVIFDCMLYGAITALLLHYYNETVRHWLISRKALLLSLLGLGLSVVQRDPMYRETFRFSLQSLCLSVMVINVLFGRWSGARDVLSGKFLVFVGQISYSLYLFHFGVLVTIEAFQANHDGLHGVASVLLYAGLSFGLAISSYYCIERPMIAVRRRFGSQRRDLVG